MVKKKLPWQVAAHNPLASPLLDWLCTAGPFISAPVNEKTHLWLGGPLRPTRPVVALEFPLQPQRLGVWLDRCVRALMQFAWPLHEGLSFTPATNGLAYQGTELVISEKEGALLTTLIKANFTPMSKEALLAEVWDYEQNVDSHTLETHLYRLRKSVEQKGWPDLPLTATTQGYQLLFLSDNKLIS